MDLKSTIRDIPDFPVPGVLFRDITTLLKNPAAFKETIDRLTERFRETPIDAIVAIESRGYIFGAPLAYQLGTGLVLVRKKGKLPAQKINVSYQLEYGSETLEIHTDAVERGARVLIVDDLIATGGSAGAAVQLVESLGGTVAALAFIIELTFLNGRDNLKGYEIYSVLQY